MHKLILVVFLFGIKLLMACGGDLAAAAGGTPMSVPEKILNGVSYSDDEWNEYLKQLHTKVSGVTVPFSRFKTDLGFGTYHALLYSSEIPRSGTFLDLGCGNGFFTAMLAQETRGQATLVGVDLVQAEIEQARKLVPTAQFLAEPIQNMSLASQSVDAIFSHLVLMLVLPLDPARDEMARVLKPGGILNAVVTRADDPTSSMSQLTDVIVRVIRKHYPNFKGVRSGDPRMQTVEGIRSVFSEEKGFTGLKHSDFVMRVTGKPSEIWANYWATTHLHFILPPQIKVEVKREAMRWMQAQGGNLVLEEPLRYFSVKRRSGEN